MYISLNENAIPANSILYSKFKVLNELKQIKVNGDPLTPEQFKRVYENLFLNHSGTITEKVFIKFLQTDKDFDMFKEFDIKG